MAGWKSQGSVLLSLSSAVISNMPPVYGMVLLTFKVGLIASGKTLTDAPRGVLFS